MREQREPAKWALSGGVGRREVIPKGVTCKVKIGDKQPQFSADISCYSGAGRLYN